MTGKYDPPNKSQLLAVDPRMSSIVEVAVAAAEAQFPTKAKEDHNASRARLKEIADSPSPKRGRKPVVTRERVRLICERLAQGETEQLACIRAGIGSTAWNAAKRADTSLVNQIASARDDWARLRHAQLAAARYESQFARSAGRKALKPTPTKQANHVVWYLIYRAPLNFAIIPADEIKKACEQFSMSLDAWRRQESAFGLLRKVYAKRAAIRGQQQPAPAHSFASATQADEWTPDDENDEWRIRP